MHRTKAPSPFVSTNLSSCCVEVDEIVPWGSAIVKDSLLGVVWRSHSTVNVYPLHLKFVLLAPLSGTSKEAQGDSWFLETRPCSHFTEPSAETEIADRPKAKVK